MTQSYATSVFQSQSRARQWASIAIGGCSVFIIAVVLLHFLRPDLDPVTNFASNYLIGSYGWVMLVAFLGLGIGLFGLAMAFYEAYSPELRPWTGIILLGIAASTVVLSGIFPDFSSEKDFALLTQLEQISALVHLFAGLIGFVAIVIAALLISNRLRKAGLLPNFYAALMWLAILIPVLFLTMLFFGEGLGIIGVIQRIFLTVVLSWLMLAAAGIRSGAITED
jgi:hypothetical protein